MSVVELGYCNARKSSCHLIGYVSWAETLKCSAVTHLRQKMILAADAVELAVVVQVVLQGDWPLQGARHKELPLLGLAHPVRKLHHVWDGSRQQDEVHMRWEHDDHLHVCHMFCINSYMSWNHDDDMHVSHMSHVMSHALEA